MKSEGKYAKNTMGILYLRGKAEEQLMVQQFLDYLQLERRYSLHTVEAYQNDLLQFCDFLQMNPNEFNPEKVTTTDVREWIIQLMEEGKHPRTVKRKISSLMSFWKFLMRNGNVSVDIMRKIVAPKTNKPLPVFYKQQEVDAALAMNDEDDYKQCLENTIIDFLYETGVRCFELIQLMDADVDLQEKTVKVLGKRNKHRIIPFGDSLAKTLEHYREMRERELPNAVTSNFFILPNGKQLYRGRVYNIVHARMKEVSTLHQQSPHVLRHTFATAMLNNGADINAVKAVLGHASLAATQVYTHTTFNEIHTIYKQAHPRAQKKEEL